MPKKPKVPIHYKVTVDVRIPDRDAAIALARRLVRLEGDSPAAEPSVQVTEWEGDRLVAVIPDEEVRE